MYQTKRKEVRTIGAVKDLWDPFECTVQADEDMEDKNISIDELAARAGYLVKNAYSVDEIAWLLDMENQLVQDAIDSGQLAYSVTQIKIMSVDEINSWMKE